MAADVRVARPWWAQGLYWTFVVGGVAVAVACIAYGVSAEIGVAVLAGTLLLLDVVFLANVGGCQADVPWLSPAYPRASALLWMGLLSVTAWALWQMPIITTFAVALVRACRAWGLAC